MSLNLAFSKEEISWLLDEKTTSNKVKYLLNEIKKAQERFKPDKAEEEPEISASFLGLKFDDKASQILNMINKYRGSYRDCPELESIEEGILSVWNPSDSHHPSLDDHANSYVQLYRSVFSRLNGFFAKSIFQESHEELITRQLEEKHQDATVMDVVGLATYKE